MEKSRSGKMDFSVLLADLPKVARLAVKVHGFFFSAASALLVTRLNSDYVMIYINKHLR